MNSHEYLLEYSGVRNKAVCLNIYFEYSPYSGLFTVIRGQGVFIHCYFGVCNNPPAPEQV